MAKTLTQLNAQIARLQKQVDAVKAKEAAGVIERIKEAIAHYGFTATDLGFSGRAARSVRAAKRGRKKAAKKTAGVIRFRDEAGHTWTGHGKRPRWYLAALESGKTAEDLEIN